MVVKVMRPGVVGFELRPRAPRHTQHPIIMLTARVEEVDRLIGLELGAGGYISKPRFPPPLVAPAP